ncbi:Uncharacterised protein [Vibrio cholerae]|nr:Uncharacterised protein [Vibrio cholerae]
MRDLLIVLHRVPVTVFFISRVNAVLQNLLGGHSTLFWFVF